MPLERGASLGPYEILAPIGAGGMGEVYRARDTRLGRDVAIKILPSETVTNPQRKERFIQEARAASALNHPSIVTIYDIDEHEGTTFLSLMNVPCLQSKGSMSNHTGEKRCHPSGQVFGPRKNIQHFHLLQATSKHPLHGCVLKALPKKGAIVDCH